VRLALVLDPVVECRVDVRGGLDLQLAAAQLLELAFEPLPAAQVIDRAAFPDDHQPGARVAWDA